MNRVYQRHGKQVKPQFKILFLTGAHKRTVRAKIHIQKQDIMPHEQQKRRKVMMSLPPKKLSKSVPTAVARVATRSLSTPR
jgi:hypothetical protein